MNRRIFVIQVFSGLLYQTVRYFLLQGEEGEKMGKRRLRMMAVAMALVVAAGQSGAGFVSGMGSVQRRKIQRSGIYNSRWLLYIMDGGKADGAFRQAGNRESCITGWKSMQRENPCPFQNLFHHRFGNGQGFLLYSMRVRAAIYLTMPAESLTPQSLHPFQTELHLSQIKQ